REKAGIFRPGVPALCACDDDTARAVLIAEASRTAAPLFLYDHRGEPGASPLPPLAPLLQRALPLPGAHQQRNAALAVAAVVRLPHRLAVAAQQPQVQEAGLRSAHWPGRLERLWPRDDLVHTALCARIGTAPPPDSEVIIDAAHNPEGSQAL